MRRSLMLALLTLTVGVCAFAQDGAATDAATLRHDNFAAMLLQELAKAPQQAVEPAQALAELKTQGLVPSSWDAAAALTHGELADVAFRLGVSYTAGSSNSPVSPAYATAFLKRNSNRLRAYSLGRGSNGISSSHVLDQGVDRAVSPSDFP